MLSHSSFLYFTQWPTVAQICYYLHSFAIILRVQCPNSSVIDTGLKVLSSWFTLQASNIQHIPIYNADGTLNGCQSRPLDTILGYPNENRRREGGGFQ